jgi:hypothetical protein
MNQITPYPLWLGHGGEGRDFKTIFDLGIRAIINLALEEPPAREPREMIYCRFPLVDGSGNASEILFLAMNTLKTLINKHVPTLVCCGAGMSRAPAIAAAGLSLAHEEAPERCLERIVAQHPSDVSPGLWKEVAGVLAAFR